MIEQFQLDFFKDPEISRLEAQIAEAKEGTNRVRKGMFARLNKLEKRYTELEIEHEMFKRAICRGEKYE